MPEESTVRLEAFSQRRSKPEGPCAVRFRGRQPGAARKQQIVEATLRLIAEYGLAGASMSRIAEAVGISNAALYRHFDSREDILIAAYHSLTERIFAWLNSADGTDVAQRLRRMGQEHARMTSIEVESFTAPMFQFISWIPKDGLHEAVRLGRLELRQWFTSLIEKGKAQGVLRSDVATDVMVGQLIAWIWWEDLSYLEALDMEVVQRVSAEMFARFLDGIIVSDARSDQDGSGLASIEARAQGDSTPRG